MQEKVYKYARREILKHVSLLHQDCKKNSTRIFSAYPFYAFSTNNKSKEKKRNPKNHPNFWDYDPKFHSDFWD